MTKRINGEIIIERPADAVFDFCADERNEPRYNPRMIMLSWHRPGRSAWARSSVPR